MHLSQLNPDERLALVVALMGAVALDGELSTEEAKQMETIANALGRENFGSLLDEAQQRIGDTESLKKTLLKVTSVESRKLIFTTVKAAAEAGGMGPDEASFVE